MNIITHEQAPSPILNLSGLTVTVTDHVASFSGSVEIDGQSVPVDTTMALEPGLIIFLSREGNLLNGPHETFAHLAWVTEEGLHIIQHPAPEPPEEPAVPEELAPTPEPEQPADEPTE